MSTAIVYGCGNFLKKNLDQIRKEYTIMAFADKNPQGYIGSEPIKRIESCVGDSDWVYLIMIENLQECIRVGRNLEEQYDIVPDRIILGVDTVSQWKNNRGIDSIKYIGKGRVKVEIKGFNCEITSLDELNNVVETLNNNAYGYYLNNEKKDIVIDVGMNVGDSTFFFVNMDNVAKVYSYEPFPGTYKRAVNNLQNSTMDHNRYETFCYGWSDTSEERFITYNSGMTCGMSSAQDITAHANSRYREMGLIDEQDNKKVKIVVRRASDEVSRIIENKTKYNYILKMDCEGEEYRIVNDLYHSKQLDEFSLIILEWHYSGKEQLLTPLKESGFSYYCNDVNSDRGMIYAFKSI